MSRGSNATTIWARIPVENAYYNSQNEFIDFQDTNSLYTVLINQQALTNVVFSRTDERNRAIAQVAPDQFEEGNMNFKFSFKWDIIEQEEPQGSTKVQLPGYTSQPSI